MTDPVFTVLAEPAQLCPTCGLVVPEPHRDGATVNCPNGHPVRMRSLSLRLATLATREVTLRSRIEALEATVQRIGDAVRQP